MDPLTKLMSYEPTKIETFHVKLTLKGGGEVFGAAYQPYDGFARIDAPDQATSGIFTIVRLDEIAAAQYLPA